MVSPLPRLPKLLKRLALVHEIIGREVYAFGLVQTERGAASALHFALHLLVSLLKRLVLVHETPGHCTAFPISLLSPRY